MMDILSWLIGFVVVPVIVCGILFYIISRWVRHRGRTNLSHLWRPLEDSQSPLVVGFFHPYCNAGGGGERVLWVAIKALQKRYKHVQCVVYTGDVDASGEEIFQRAKDRFNIYLPKPIEFIFLHKRPWVEAARYPYFTLLGQSLGSLILGWEAMTKCVPDIYIDTMGYAFTMPLFRYFGGCKVACYTHYPTISTDMLHRVADRAAAHNNAAFIARNPVLSNFKLIYYKLFAYIYGFAGRRSDVVMVNSSWTEGHIKSIWHVPERTYILYPPCDTSDFLALPLNNQPTNKHSIVSVAQFRPEKDHPLQLKAFKEFLSRIPDSEKSRYVLVLVGSCRDEGDQERVETLRGLSKELGIETHVDFQLNVSFDVLKRNINEATIGLHTMWNEHFGIGVVELMAGGPVVLAHDSGGPKMDIVVDYEGQRTGYLADNVAGYADAMEAIFKLKPKDRLNICENARKSVNRFSEEEFQKGFLDITEDLLKR